MRFLNSIRVTLESIIRIIQESPPFEIPISLDKSFLLVSYCQIGVYIFESYSDKIITNSILKPITQIVQFASLNRTLVLQSTDALSILILSFSCLLLFAFLTYAITLTIIKNSFPSFYDSYKSSIQTINSYINFSFYLFIFCFQNYQIELSTSIIFCGDRSLLMNDRISTQCQISWWQFSLGIFGLIFVAFFTIVQILFFKNVEFHQSNRLTRTMSTPYKFTIALRATVTLIEMSGLSLQKITATRHILLHLFGLINLGDAVINHPYSNKEIARFNITISSYFYCIVVICNFWMYSDIVDEYEIFFLSILISIVVSSFLLSAHSYNYESLFSTDIFKQFRTDQSLLSFPIDSYLEEWVAIAQSSQVSETNKYKTFNIYIFHIQTCLLPRCPCKISQQQANALASANTNANPNAIMTSNAAVVVAANAAGTTTGASGNAKKITGIGTYKNQLVTSDGHDIELSVVYQIVDEIFRWLLEQRVVVEDSRRFELLSLKYITFMIKFQKNYVRAFYELKVLIQRRQTKGRSFSLYFNMLSTIISEDLQVIISRLNEQNLLSKRKEELTFKHITDSDQLCWEFMPVCIEVLKEKQVMWGKMQKGFASMNTYQNEALFLSNIIENARTEYFKSIRRLQLNRDFSWCLTLKKLNMIFYLFVMNDCNRAFELEQDVLDLRKRDAFLEEDCLNNENVVKKNIVSLIVSISASLGKIVSRKDIKTAEFFGYSKQEFQKIDTITELIPSFIAVHHDSIVSSFLRRGTSKNIKTAMTSFARESTGFIMPIQIHLDFCFENQNDFLMQGTLLKIDKQADYILFDRKGKILGVSKGISQLMLVDTEIMNQLPLADNIIKNLNAFTLLPRIVRPLVGKKKEIKEISENQDSEILISDAKGQVYFDTQFMQHARGFAQYLSRSTENPVQYMKMFQKTTGQKYTKNNQNVNLDALDSLDVFSKESYEKYIKFKKQSKQLFSNTKVSTSSYKTQTDRESVHSGGSSASRKVKQNLKNKYNKYSAPAAAAAMRNFFKLSFKYTMSFHILKVPKKSTSSSSHHYSEKSKSKEQMSKNMFFSVRMRDIKLQKSHNNNNGQTNKVELLASRIASYFKTISCVPVLNAHLQRDPREFQKMVSSQPQIPKSFLTHITEPTRTKDKHNPGSPKSNHSASSFKKGKSRTGQMRSQTKDSSRTSGVTDTEGRTDLISADWSDSLSNTSDHSQEFSRLSLDSQQGMSNQFKDPRQMQYVAEQFKKLQSAPNELEELLEAHNINQYELSYLDNNYTSKRVIQAKIKARKLISALEVAFVEDVIENHRKEQVPSQLLNSQLLASVDNIKSTGDMSQVTFRQNEEFHKKDEDIHNQLLYPSNTLGVDGHTPKGILVNHGKNQVQHFLNSQISVGGGTGATGGNTLPTQTMEEDPNTGEIQTMSGFKIILQTDNMATEENLTQINLKTANNTSRPFMQKNQASSVNIFGDENVHSTSNMNQTAEDFNESRLPMHINTTMQNQNQNDLSFSEMNPMHSTVMARQLQGTSKAVVHEGISMKNDDMLINSMLSDNVDGELNGKKSQATHEAVVTNLLNQSGMMHGKVDNNNASVHSSSRSSSTNGNYFLREIIYKSKIPVGATQFGVMMIIFSLLFIGLNIVNYVIIKSDMQTFTNNVVVLRLPRKLLRDYVKSIYGYYIELQLEGGYFLDTSSSAYNTIAEDYVYNSARSYNSIIEQNQQTLIESMQELQSYLNVYDETFYFSEDFNQQEQDLNLAILFSVPINYLLGIQANSTEARQASSFIMLRSNLYTMKNYVLSLADYLVNGVLDTTDSLILKFTWIGIAAICGLMLIPGICYTIAQKINLYEEKILMMASRISLEHSEIEKFKQSVCARLLSLDTYDWLKYQYLDVVNLRFNMFDVKQSKGQVQLHQSHSGGGIGNMKLSKFKQSGQNFTRKRSLRSTQLQMSQLANTKEEPSIYNSHKASQKNNYILQSKIGYQKLSVIMRITSFLGLMSLGIAYFLVVIIYLNLNTSALQTPVQINRTANVLHANSITFIISAELLAYDAYLSDLKWPKYSLTDLDLFQTSMLDSLDEIQSQSQILQDSIYGDTPFDAATVDKFKNLIEGDVCGYVTNYPCQTTSVTDKGLSSIVSNFKEIYNSFSYVLTPDATVAADLKVYLNSIERISVFVEGFQTPDEVMDILGVTANSSIGIVSQGIQDFLEKYLMICGNILAGVMIVLFIFTWRSILKTIHLMNLFLTFIPEEKLLEDVTLQMLKQIRRM